MTLAVTFLGDDPIATATWEAYVAAHPDATVYHRLAWREIFGSGLGYRSWMLMARDAQGSLCGVLPLYLVATPFRRRLVAVPFRDRGGPLWDTPDALDALITRARRLCSETGAAALVLKTIRPFPDETVTVHGLARDDHWVHSTLDLGALTVERLWHHLGPKTRNMIRQAQSRGLASAVTTADDGAIERWYRLHLATQKRLGVPPFPYRFFSLMVRKLRPTGNIEIVEVGRSHASCAAMLLLLHRNTSIYGYSASNEEGLTLRANDFMLHTALQRALERGMAQFDFGSDSPAQKSLLFFKRKWGAAQAPIPVYSTGKGAARIDSSGGRYALGRRVLRRMPEVVLRHVGSRVTRYFG